MMRWMTAGLLLVAVLGATAAPGITNVVSYIKSLLPHSNEKVIGGVAVKLDNFQYQLALFINNKFSCGGSIISVQWALTAAHCSQNPAYEITLRSGSSDRTAGGYLHQVIQKIVHAQYSTDTFDYDIALLKVSTNFSSLVAVTLPSQGQPVPENYMVTVSGWGLNFPYVGQIPKYLQSVTVPVVSPARCSLMYALSVTISERMLCTNYIFGVKGSCNGDSGGPLTAVIGGVKQLVGVVSFGKVFCTLPTVPSVYARVPAFRDWIRANSGV